MKVKDVMTSPAIFVEEDLPVKKLLKLIFTTNIPGFPVTKSNKVIGFIAEEDIFFKIYDINSKEAKSRKTLGSILDKKVKDFMVKKVFSVNPDQEVTDVQLNLYKYHFFQIPVVDSKNNLVGTLTRGDVFRYIVDEEMPSLEAEQYASFIAENFDQMVNWEKRFDLEFPTLFRIFTKKNVEKVLKVGLKTGGYAIELARNGLEVTSITQDPLTINYAKEKTSGMPSNVKKRLQFKLSDYKNFDTEFKPGSFDAAICIGGTLPYISASPEKIISNMKKVVKKNGAVVVQLLNLERVIEDKQRFLYFKIKGEGGKEDLYVEFFDKKNEDTLVHNIIHFESSGDRWLYRGINSVDIKYLKNKDILPMFKKAGFKEVVITGNKGEYRGQFGQMSLVKPFDPKTSEWMTVIAHT
jgi:predicted transcriptional regulator/precorrin-6B methylase 2